MESPQNRMHPLEAYWLPSAPEAFWHLDHVDRERARTKNHDVNSCSTRVHMRFLGNVCINYWSPMNLHNCSWVFPGCRDFPIYEPGLTTHKLGCRSSMWVCSKGGSSLGPPCFLIVDANGEPAFAGLGGCPLPSSQRQRCLVLMPPTRPARTESGSAR